MKRKIGCMLINAALLIWGCGNSSNERSGQHTAPAAPEPAASTSADDGRGIGKFKNVELTHPLDEAMIAKGVQIYDVKCSACHKLDDQKVVGPGWKGVTDRRKPEWIMNFITNVDEMLDKDTEAKTMLEVCMVRMPNQNLSDEDARAILEYMRKNDNKN